MGFVGCWGVDCCLGHHLVLIAFYALIDEVHKGLKPFGHAEADERIDDICEASVGRVAVAACLFQCSGFGGRAFFVAHVEQLFNFCVGQFELRHIDAEPKFAHVWGVFAFAVANQVVDSARFAVELHVGVDVIIFEILHECACGAGHVGQGKSQKTFHCLFETHEHVVAHAVVFGDGLGVEVGLLWNIQLIFFFKCRFQFLDCCFGNGVASDCRFGGYLFYNGFHELKMNCVVEIHQI